MNKKLLLLLVLVASCLALPKRIQQKCQKQASHGTVAMLATLLMGGQDSTEYETPVTPITVFAPSDIALSGVDARSFKDLGEVVKNHVVRGAAINANDIKKGTTTLTSWEGFPIEVKKTKRGVWVNGVRVLQANAFVTPTHVVHVIAGVLPLPKAEPIISLAIATPSLSTLVSVVSGNAAVVNTLSGEGPFTVFAPLNSAFEGLDLSGVDVGKVLRHHVFGGAAVFSSDLKESQTITSSSNGKLKITKDADGTVMVNGARVVIADIKASNGVIHVIDQVLIPLGTIIETAVAVPDLSILASVLSLPDYAPVMVGLNGQGFFDGSSPAVWAPFTVFAPNNDAFAALGAVPQDVSAVTDILKYHVIAGDLFAENIEVGSQELWTLQGATLTIRKEADGTVFVNDAQVVIADVKASNGVVHVIDTVLIPPKTSSSSDDVTQGSMNLKMLKWDVTNDSVMGGVSVSAAKLMMEEGEPVINFAGTVTTDSNGGFVNAYGRTSSTTGIDLSSCEGISFTAKKDNDKVERFEFSLASGKSNMWSGSDSVFYNFYPTTEWETYNVPFADFQEMVSFGGFGGNSQTFDQSAVNVFGLKRSAFLDGLNKDPEFKSGPFSLKIKDVMCMGGAAAGTEAKKMSNSVELGAMKWEVVNDSVMGGISNSNVKMMSGAVVFSGTTTTDSNGGFTNANARPAAKLDLSNCKKLTFEAKGDETRRYSMSLMSGEMSMFGNAPSVSADFYPPTEWDTVEIAMDDLTPVRSWNGSGANEFNAAMTSIIGFSRSAFINGFQKDPEFVSGPFELMLRNFQCVMS